MQSCVTALVLLTIVNASDTKIYMHKTFLCIVMLIVLQLKVIWIDAWCPTLTCTWESSAYQRAIAVDALWLTFMRMLEPGSHIKVRNIFCVHDEGKAYLWLLSASLVFQHICADACD